jgi:cell division protein FtsB
VKLFFAIGFLVLVSFLFLIGLGNQGAVDLYQLRLQKNHILQNNATLREKNENLYRTIHRLKADPGFVENIARTELGMIRDDEMVILKKRR